MRRFLFALAATSSVALCISACSPGASPPPDGAAQAAEAGSAPKGGVGEIAGPYQPELKWPQWAYPYPKAGYIWGSQGGVFAESPDRIYFANRGELKLPDKMPPLLPAFGISGEFPGFWGAFGYQAANEPIANMANIIVIVDGSGKLVEAWNQWDKLFEFGRGPHSIYISPYDPERHVWVVDDFRHAIFKFSHDGKELVQTIGVPGEWGDNEDLMHLNRPTAIDWFKDGSFVVSDGYSNTRVVKYDKDGKPLMKWGTRGKGPGEFNGPHGIAVSGSGDRVFVSDRGNSRIQVFDANGAFIEEWPGVRANALMMSGDDQHVWVADIGDDRIIQYDLNGRVTQAWGQFGLRPGYTWCPHQISADADGNLFVAECFNGRQQKFAPKAGADPGRLVRPRSLMPTPGSTN
jgi:sugar lactone lactonase YvrE